MSAIAAILDLEGRAPGEAPVRALLARMPKRGPDYVGVACLGEAVLGHGLLQTLPEDRPGRQPSTGPQGIVTVVLDGRVDNRAELLAVAGGHEDGQTDAAVIAAALEARGDGVLGQVLGDFALIAWHARTRTLIAARDVFGLRPLVYRRVGARLLLASRMGAVAAGHPATIDDGFAGEVLAGRVTSLTATLLTGVSRLAPGCLLVARESRIVAAPFTVLALGEPSRRPAPALEEECRDLLGRAVRARARASSPVGVMLSGGIDSAAVYATARGGAAPRVEAWTSDQREGSNETARAAALVRHFGGMHHVTPAAAGAFDYEGEAAGSGELPFDPSGANSLALFRDAAARGVRVLLNGVGGDEFFATNRWHAADLLARGRLVALARLWRSQRQGVDPVPALALLQAAVAPLVPRALRPVAAAALPAARLPAWIRPDWARRIELRERLRRRGSHGGRTHAERARLLTALGGRSVWAHEDADAVMTHAGIEMRTPFFDRRVAEFTLNAPEAALAAAGESKALLRSAFRPVLPPAWHRPVAPLSFEHLTAEALDRIGGPGWFDRMLLVDAGWVDGRWIRRALDRVWPHGTAPASAGESQPLEGLWQMALVEAWLRARERHDGEPA